MNLENLITEVENLHNTLMGLTGEFDTATIDSTNFAVHHYISAIADLEKAKSNLSLALLFQGRELAGNF